jgi:hypothetical protein
VGVAMVRTNTAPGDVLKVNYMKLAPSGYAFQKRRLGRESAEQREANAAANRSRPNADPLFDGR